MQRVLHFHEVTAMRGAHSPEAMKLSASGIPAMTLADLYDENSLGGERAAGNCQRGR